MSVQNSHISQDRSFEISKECLSGCHMYTLAVSRMLMSMHVTWFMDLSGA